MRVSLQTHHVSGTIKLDAAEVCKELAAQNLGIDEGLKAKIAALCEQRLAVGTEHTLIAGEPTAAPQPPRAQLVDEIVAAHPPLAKAGQRIAAIIPAEPGREGKDVFGQPCAPDAPPTLDTLLGTNVSLSEDHQSLLAAIDGIVHVSADGRISVSCAERIEFDLYTPVAMECATDLVVGGSIKEGTAVNCTNDGSLYVNGDLQSSAAANDIYVKGAVLTGPNAIAAGKTVSMSAAGSINAGTLASCTVNAGGDLIVKEDITNAVVTCGGRLVAPSATIHATTLLVTGAAECRTIGSEDHTRTVIEIGAEPTLRKLITELLPQIEQRREHVAKVRRTVQPLLNDAKRLTREQKERCTELLYDSETTDAEATAMLKRLTEGNDRLLASAGRELVVHELAHPGVTVRFAGVETTLRLALRGPLVIRVVTDRSMPAIVCKSQKSNQDVPLETRQVPDDPILTLRQYLAQEARRQKAA